MDVPRTFRTGSAAVALLGPRQVGNTTLAKAIAAGRPQSVYLDLERPADLARLTAQVAMLVRASPRRRPIQFFAFRRRNEMAATNLKRAASRDE
jgi:predicted AAA+ superfamily ATPase